MDDFLFNLSSVAQLVVICATLGQRGEISLNQSVLLMELVGREYLEHG